VGCLPGAVARRSGRPHPRGAQYSAARRARCGCRPHTSDGWRTADVLDAPPGAVRLDALVAGPKHQPDRAASASSRQVVALILAERVGIWCSRCRDGGGRRSALEAAGAGHDHGYRCWLRRDADHQGRRGSRGRGGAVHCVVLEEVAGDRQLSFEIGQAEAFSLAARLGGIQWRRPMTYQFAAALVQALGGRVR
jgi:hypothetical protein